MKSKLKPWFVSEVLFLCIKSDVQMFERPRDECYLTCFEYNFYNFVSFDYKSIHGI